MTLSVLSRSPERTRALGEALGRALEPGTTIGLSGPLGAGKTCFVQGLAIGLGVDPRVAVTSPTFTLVGEYPGRVALRHADFYRVDTLARLEDAGFADLLDGRGVLVVEWFERFPQALPSDRLELHIALLSDCDRQLQLLACGPVASATLGRLGAPWR